MHLRIKAVGEREKELFSWRCSRHRPSPCKYQNDDLYDDDYDDDYDYDHDYGEDDKYDDYEDAPATAEVLANILMMVMMMLMVKMMMMSIAERKQDVKTQDTGYSQDTQRLTI